MHVSEYLVGVSFPVPSSVTEFAFYQSDWHHLWIAAKDSTRIKYAYESHHNQDIQQEVDLIISKSIPISVWSK